MDGAATIRIAVWIKSEEDLNSLAPVSAISLGIEQAHVELHVLAIICSQRLGGRWLVKKGLCRLNHHSLTIR